MKFALIVPTRNAGTLFEAWLALLSQQTLAPAQVVIVDSQSSDGTPERARQAGCLVHGIAAADFNHGGSRNLGVSLLEADVDIVIFMTQDALLHAPQAFEMLLAAFANPNVAAAYGRQLPHENANPLAAHARLFNYPAASAIKSQADIARFGIKTVFISNSFAAYRLSAWRELGGFPEDIILAEDMYLAAKMILAGYEIAYCAEATVRHSHNYTLMQEFRRYFDTGVFHREAGWIQESLGGATGEGKRFVLSEWRYLWQNAPHWLLLSPFFTFAKWTGYQLGRHWQRLPHWLLPHLSMNRQFWRRSCHKTHDIQGSKPPVA
ncbi:MAG: glycosyltransferase family A protein [Cardiobacteriaceae bacterium]|nr:glycosyltransferase family A protein [Cardiobacteriaceae bacterium]